MVCDGGGRWALKQAEHAEGFCGTVRLFGFGKRQKGDGDGTEMTRTQKPSVAEFITGPIRQSRRIGLEILPSSSLKLKPSSLDFL